MLCGLMYHVIIGGMIHTCGRAASVCRLRRWMGESGVSRAASTSGRFSFTHTSAARSSKLSANPQAIPATLFMLQGTTSMPSVRNVPLAMAASVGLPS